MNREKAVKGALKRLADGFAQSAVDIMCVGGYAGDIDLSTVVYHRPSDRAFQVELEISAAPGGAPE